MGGSDRFGKYTLLERISVGGMAEVFRAQTAAGELRAIKRILPNMAEDPTFIKMFVEEARVTSQLVHPNICRIYELGRLDGSHFIAMEYIHGKDLLAVRGRLRKLREPMSVPIALGIMSRALDGLDYAHKKRDAFGRAFELVHRDCSPHNLLLSYDGEVKVIDFGIAKAKSTALQSQAGLLKGKFAYMAPEQVAGKRIDHRCDIFACGIILCELITGEPLFSGDSDFAILDKVRHVSIRPPREICPSMPAEVEAVILRALARDVGDRYAWCSDMKADVDRCGGATTAELSAWIRRLFPNESAGGPVKAVAAPGPGSSPGTKSSPGRAPTPPPAPPPVPPAPAYSGHGYEREPHDTLPPPPAGEFDEEKPTELHSTDGSSPGAAPWGRPKRQ